MHDLDAAYGHLNKHEGTCALYTRATHSIVAVERMRLRSGEDRRTRTNQWLSQTKVYNLAYTLSFRCGDAWILVLNEIELHEPMAEVL